MNDLIKGALIGAAIATVVAAAVSTPTSPGDEPEYRIARSVQAEHSAATANPRCAPRPVKMPCLWKDS